MRKNSPLFFTLILLPLDYLVLLIAAFSAYAIRFTPWIVQARPITFDLSLSDFSKIVFPLSLVWMGIFALSGLYSLEQKRLASQITKVIIGVSAAIATTLGIAFLSRELFDSRFIVLAVWAMAIFLLTLERISLYFVQNFLRKKGISMTHIVVIGKLKTAQPLISFFTKNPQKGFSVTAQYATFNKETKKRIQEQKHLGKVDAIFVVDPEIPTSNLREIQAWSDIEHVSFFFSTDFMPSPSIQPSLHVFSGIPVVEVPKTSLDNWGAVYKRLFDITGASLLIFLSLPIQILTALALLFERQGGILFKHERIGQHEKPFPYFKFRSMIKNAHQFRENPKFLSENTNMRDGTPLFKIKKDPRVTRIGSFIRSFSIDEIPEFYLVLFGYMSLVGPRPHLPEEVHQYKPEQRKVLTIKPGITGLAQVSGRASLSFDEEIRLDMYYIQNWNPWLDIIILLKTPLVVLFQDGNGAPKK